MSTDRLERLTAALREAGMPALVLMPAANLQYLTGLTFHPGKRITLAILPASGTEPCFVIPALEMVRAQSSSVLPMRYYPWHDADGPAAALRQALRQALGEKPAGPVGVEYTALRLLELRAMEAALPGLTTADATTLLAGLRMVKDEQELAAMAEAARIVELALASTIAQIRPGMTERELSAICTREIMAAGAEGESFENIIAAGPNGANPHHSKSDRAFQPGDLIVIDCGAVYGGYLSDITRTVALGEPDPEARRIYELVLAANRAGCAAVRPGASGAQIDAAARVAITAGGYGDQFIHRTGHGLGLESHELPNIVAGSDEPLAVGTTFTIEPGIYVPGFCGVRIEDDLVVTEDGGHSLTSFERELIVLPV